MKYTKSIFLFLLLVFPVLIYFFLQGFGENQFEIPVYYENGIGEILDGCQPHSGLAPYQVDQSSIEGMLGIDGFDNTINVFDIGNRDSDLLRNNLYTFLEKYKDHEKVNLISVKTLNDTAFSESRYNKWQRFNLNDSNLLRFGRCILQLDLDHNFEADSGLVLVDHQRQIRGYYDPNELKEIDRLNTELYILISNLETYK